MKKPNGKPTRKALALRNGIVNMNAVKYNKGGKLKVSSATKSVPHPLVFIGCWIGVDTSL